MFWNPAGAAGLRRGLDLGFGRLIEGGSQGTAAYGVPGGRGDWAFGLRFFTPGALEGFDAVGDPTGEFRPHDLALGAAYARRGARWSSGVGLTAIRSELAGASGAAFAFSAGLLGRDATVLGDGPVDIGLFLRHLGPPLRLGGRAEPLPFAGGAGLAWRPSEGLRLLAELRLPSDRDPTVAFGAELERPLGGLVGSLRGGFDLARQEDIGAGGAFSAGLGLAFPSFRLDYAWAAFGELGNAHRVSFGVPLGAAPSEPPPPPPPEASLRRVAVLRLSAKGLEAAWAAAASEFLADALQEAQGLEVLDRASVDRRLRLAGHEPGRCEGSGCARRQARELGADRVVYGSLSYVGGVYSLQVEAAEAGGVLFRGSELAQEPAGLRAAARTLVQRMLEGR